jgi:hypothetical protein
MNSSFNKIIYKQIQSILLEEWDPIGVKHIPEAQDEYDNYALQVYKMLTERKTFEDLSKYLYFIETEHIGISGNHKRVKKAVVALFQLVSKS